MNTLGKLELNHCLLGTNVKDQLLWLFALGTCCDSKYCTYRVVLNHQHGVGVEKCDGIEGEVRKNLL